MTFHVLSWLLDQEPADFVLSDTVLATDEGGQLLTTSPVNPSSYPSENWSPVRITGLRATPVAVPFTQPESWAFGERTGMVSVLLEVDTDEGPVGLGEAAAYPSADIIEAVLRTVEPLFSASRRSTSSGS